MKTSRKITTKTLRSIPRVAQPTGPKLTSHGLIIVQLQDRIEEAELAAGKAARNLTNPEFILRSRADDIGWMDDTAILMVIGSHAEQVLAWASMAMEKQNINPSSFTIVNGEQCIPCDDDIIVSSLISAISWKRDELHRELTHNQHRGMSSSQMSNALDAAKREAAARFYESLDSYHHRLINHKE